MIDKICNAGITIAAIIGGLLLIVYAHHLALALPLGQ